jgi:hypothetical protein
MKGINIHVSLIIILLILNFCSCNSKRVNCTDVKKYCVNFVKSNKDEIRDIILNQINRDPKDNKITLQRALEFYKEYKFTADLDKQQNYLKKYCPEEYENYCQEIVLLILGEIFKSSIFTNNDNFSIEDLVSNIRQQFNEVAILEKNNQYTYCHDGSSTINNYINEQKMTFTQKSKRCNYPGGYSIITSKFENWEYQATYKLYFRNDELFFVFNTESGVSYVSEFRTYYKNGNAIRILEKEIISETDNPKNVNIEITNSSRGIEVVNLNKDKLNESINMLR